MVVYSCNPSSQTRQAWLLRQSIMNPRPTCAVVWDPASKQTKSTENISVPLSIVWKYVYLLWELVVLQSFNITFYSRIMWSFIGSNQLLAVCVHVMVVSVYSKDFGVTMVQEHRFSSPQIPCSNVKSVSWSFSTTNNVINQGKFRIRWRVHQEKAVTARWGKLSYRPKILSDKILSFGDGGS